MQMSGTMSRPLLVGAAVIAFLGLGVSSVQAKTAGPHGGRSGFEQKVDRLESLADRNHAIELRQRQLSNELDWMASHGRDGARVEAVADRLQALSKRDGALLLREGALVRQIDARSGGEVPARVEQKIDIVRAEIGRDRAIARREQGVVNQIDWRLANDRPVGTTEALADGLQHLSGKANSFARTEDRMTSRVDQRLDR